MNNDFTKSKKYSEKHHTQTRQCGLLNAGYASNQCHSSIQNCILKLHLYVCKCLPLWVIKKLYIVLVNARPNTGPKPPKMVAYHLHFPAFSKFPISNQKPPTSYTCCTVDFLNFGTDVLYMIQIN